MRYFVFDQFNSCLQDKEEQLDEGEKSITVDECLIDIIKGKASFFTVGFESNYGLNWNVEMNIIVKQERAKDRFWN